MEGKIIDGRFEILAVLGEGGMAKVYRAFDEFEQREVAIKIVSHGGSKDDDALPRFSREFRLCQQVNHPNIIKLHHFGSLDQKSCYTVMDVVEGTDLRQLLELEGRLDEELVLHIAKKLASALSCLHENNIVHRDLKPANIMVAEIEPDQKEDEPIQGAGLSSSENAAPNKWTKWRPIIMDFGLARGINMTRLTATGTIMGTPYYMSPELAIGEKADSRSDFFQLGSILYELLTGKKAFEGRQIAELLNNIVSKDPVPVNDIVPELSAGWEAILDKCLEKDPAFRYQSAEELLTALEGFHETKDWPKNASTSKDNAQTPIKQLQKKQECERQAQIAPQPKDDSQALRALVIVAVSTLALCIALFYGLQSPEQLNYSCRKIKTKPLAHSVTITWESEHPYASIVEIVSPKRRVVGSAKDTKTKSHKVCIDGLSEQESYQFKIVYPNGESSLTKSFKTAKMQFFILAALKQKDELFIQWSLKPEAEKCQLLIYEDGKEPLRKPLQRERIDRLAIPALSPKTHRITLLAEYEEGRKKEWDFRQALLSQIAKERKEIGSFTAEGVIAEFATVAFRPPSLTVRRVASKSLNEGDFKAARKAEREEAVTRRKRMKALLMKELAKCEREITAYKKLCNFSHLALSASVLTLEEQGKFDKLIAPFTAIHSFAVYEKIGDELFSPANRGDFAFRSSALSRHYDAIVIYQDKSGKTIDLGIPVPFKHKARERWNGTFSIPSLEGVTRAELCFQFRRFDNTSMRIRINGKTDIKTHGHRGFAAAGRYFWQNIPLRTLNEGKNEIEFIYAKIAQGHLESRVRIINCTLHLAR